MAQDTTAQQLKAAQTHVYGGRFEDALAILLSLGENAEALYMRAVCERYLKRYDAALDTLSHIFTLTPEFGRALQEEGHVLRDMGRHEDALLAYKRACAANPALEASWRAQAALSQGTDAAQALAQAERLAKLPKDLLAISLLIHEGKLLKAERLCRDYLKRHPHDVEAMRLLADIGARFSVLDNADFLLETALELAPDNIQVRLDYITVLNKRQKYGQALEQARKLYESAPNNPHFQSTYAVANLHLGEFEEALGLFDAVLKTLPQDPATLTSRGHALKTYGRQEEAIASYQAAYKAKPDHGDAYYALANLKTYKFNDKELTAMAEAEARPHTSRHDRIHLCFALGKGYEDRGEFETSFIYYTRGNALKKQASRYDADHMEEELKAQATICTRDLFDARMGEGCPAPDPIFIVGLPRAGSTLLEQILASHSKVDGTLELPHILATAQKLKGRERATATARYPHVLHDLPAEELKKLGQKYIDETQVYRKGAPYFTDKMPNNFRHIGLIKLILPNAKIIDARRHPMACCFSGFKQLFAEGQEFTYSLEDIGRYYKDYVDVMAHWDKVLPGQILRVHYEDVVADIEGQVRRILDYCGLDFEPACVQFHKTMRAVRTASSEQVRQPIYQSGLEQWRHYEPWLKPLKSALGGALTTYPMSN